MLLAATPAVAQDWTAPYAEDVLSEQAQEQTQTASCPDVTLRGLSTLTTGEADALLCLAVQKLPLARSVAEYGCTDRSELLIGALLRSGVPYEAIGRVSTFLDTQAAQSPSAFVLPDATHGDAFQQAWHQVFGKDFRHTILLKGEEQELTLDVDGEIRWNIGHIAPTVWVVDKAGQKPVLRVLDPVLSPTRSLTLEEWRKLQNAPDAALAWGALGEPPMLMGEYLPDGALAEWRKLNGLAATDEVVPAQINTTLRALPPETRVQMQGDMLGIAEKAAWHPAHWTGYSFAGGQGDLPEWKPGRDDITEARLNAAVKKLALLDAYERMRAEFDTDLAFLEVVRTRLLKRNKKPEEVIIYFDGELGADAAR